MTIKMNDIAKMANVSKSSVSLAINGKDGISEETRRKILQTISEQGYVPLRKTSKNTTPKLGEITFMAVTTKGVVQNDYRSLPFFNSLISSLSVNVDQLGGTLRTVTVPIEELADQLDDIAHSSLNGVVVLGTDLTKKQVLLIDKKIQNVVFLDTYFEDIDADFVTMDNYQGAKLAAEYLLEKGYQKIGYFASAKLMSNFNERRRGFHERLMSSGIQVENKHFYFISPTELEPHGVDTEILMGDLPEAIFCEDDYIAIRLIKAARKAGIKVPKDLAVMGFDDIYEGTLISPELSTIHVPINQIAQQALAQLKGKLEIKEWNSQKTLVATRLIKRESL